MAVLNRVQAKAAKVGWLTLALTLVLVAAWLVIMGGFRPAPKPPEVPEPVVERPGPAPQSGEAAIRHAKMLAAGAYNAAFAAGLEGAYGWADNLARIEDAEKLALAHCRAHGDGCRIVLRIVPAAPVALEGRPLSRTAAEALRAYPARERSKAIALTGHGGWGGAWGRQSMQAAIEAALDGCRKQAVTIAPGMELKTECRIVWAE